MDQIPRTSVLPPSIATVDSTVYVEPEAAAVLSIRTADDQAAGSAVLQERLLAGIVARSGELEAAEWAVDQAQAALDEQIVSALSAGVPPEQVAEAAGLGVAELPEFAGVQVPVAMES
ncbi:hypothetical protein [Arthrobacter mobilis]|uniref:Uncharacterized protein n=1 Tax=Arthrobacter mobilis TaxID=2724944 RepID=A0A7X6HGM3_9MICC|nr:hypothetical protein [Arthrobacter mobilis]NKX55803.1 hypothetical protein [Arthrobacter mobilis]